MAVEERYEIKRYIETNTTRIFDRLKKKETNPLMLEEIKRELEVLHLLKEIVSD